MIRGVVVLRGVGTVGGWAGARVETVAPSAGGLGSSHVDWLPFRSALSAPPPLPSSLAWLGLAQPRRHRNNITDTNHHSFPCARYQAFQHPRLTVAEPRRCVTPTITVTDCDGDDSTGTCIVHSEESIEAVLALEEEEAEAARQNRSVADMRAEAEARRTGAYWMVF